MRFDHDKFRAVTIPMIRRVLPELTAREILSVQPMLDPGFNLFFENTPMMNIRQRSVNVDRHQLLSKLRENRELHAAEYAEALTEYRNRLLADLKAAATKVENTEDYSKLLKFRFNVPAPQDHTADYDEVIEMLSMSVDAVINLDSESFKAYIKNEWSWTQNFLQTKMLYASAGSAFQG